MFRGALQPKSGSISCSARSLTSKRDRALSVLSFEIGEHHRSNLRLRILSLKILSASHHDGRDRASAFW
jgi:hypothetical protein